MFLNDLGLDCFDVQGKLAKNQGVAGERLLLAGEPIDLIGLHHLIMSNPPLQLNKLGAYCEKNQIPICSINWDMPKVSNNVIIMQHVDALSTFIGSTHKQIERYVVCMARTLIEESELKVSRITKRSGVVKHVKRLKQLADYYQTRILLINEVNDGVVYVGDVILKVEVNRIYLP